MMILDLACAIFGHKWGTPAGARSWYDRCPRCKRCVLRPMSIAFRDRDLERSRSLNKEHEG